jgi:hypothetical protein
MKKLLIIIIGIIFTISLYSQEVTKKDIVIQKTTPMLHINGLGGYINFYNADVTLVQASNELNINGGRLDVNANLKVGEDANAAIISEINISGGTYYMLNSTGDTIPVKILASQIIDGDTIYPNITSAAADTTGIDPGKIGDIYINTSTGKVYVSITTNRGGWRILN